MWRNEKYETVPLDVQGTDEDDSKGTRDSLYPQTAVSHNNRKTFLSTDFVQFLICFPVFLVQHNLQGKLWTNIWTFECFSLHLLSGTGDM